MWTVGKKPNVGRIKLLPRDIGEHRFISHELRLLLKMFPDAQIPCQTFVSYAPWRAHDWYIANTKYSM